MDNATIIQDTQKKIDDATEHFRQELNKLRTGRANATMLDGIMVEAYGQNMPLNQVANVTVPDATLLQITPFDPNNLAAISTAIRENQSLGFNPSDDGRVVRVPIPPLTEERRREIAKQVGVKLEDSLISMRKIRHESMNHIDLAKKDKSMGEDDAKRLSDKIEEIMNQAKIGVEQAAKSKEQEIMKI